MDIPGTVRVVAQVKIIGLARDKWQLELRVSTEMDAEERRRVIHWRASSLTLANRKSGEWPNTGDVVVWYAEVDTFGRTRNIVDWHPLEST